MVLCFFDFPCTNSLVSSFQVQTHRLSGGQFPAGIIFTSAAMWRTFSTCRVRTPADTVFASAERRVPKSRDAARRVRRRVRAPPNLNRPPPTDLRLQSGGSFDGNRLTGLDLSKQRVKIGLTTIYLEGRETLRASRMRCCCWSGTGNFVTAILSSTL